MDDETRSGGPHGVPTDVDWRAERRWSDGPWVLVGVCLVTFAAMSAAAFQVGGAAAGTGGVVGGAVVFVVLLWRVRSVQGQVVRETGLSRRQIPVVARRLQKERVPADPVARRAMAIMARRQRRQLLSGRWLAPVTTVLYVVFGVASLVAGDRWLGVFWLGMTALTAVSFVVQRRSLSRLDRVEAQLAPATVA